MKHHPGGRERSGLAESQGVTFRCSIGFYQARLEATHPQGAPESSFSFKANILINQHTAQRNARSVTAPTGAAKGRSLDFALNFAFNSGLFQPRQHRVALFGCHWHQLQEHLLGHFRVPVTRQLCIPHRGEKGDRDHRRNRPRGHRASCLE